MSDSLSLGDLGYPTADTVRRAQAYHDILTDLIAELRTEAETCVYPERMPSYVSGMVNRAEARLREVEDE